MNAYLITANGAAAVFLGDSMQKALDDAWLFELKVCADNGEESGERDDYERSMESCVLLGHLPEDWYTVVP